MVIAAVAAGLLVLLAFAGLRYGFAAGPVRAAVEARLSATFGQPVTVGTLRVSLFPDVVFTGSDVRLGAGDERAPSIAVARVTVRPRVRTLFGGAPAVAEVLLDSFSVSVFRSVNDGWRVPAVAPASRAPSSGGVSIERVRVTNGRIRIYDQAANGTLHESAGIDDVEAELVPGDDGLHIAPLKGRVGGASIVGDARVSAKAVQLQFSAPSFADSDLDPLLALAANGRPRVVSLDGAGSVNVTIAIDRGTARLVGEGTVSAPAVTIGPLKVAGLQAPFRLAGARLVFAPTTFALSGGWHRGTTVLDLGADPPRWSGEGRLERIDTGALLDAIAGRDTHVDGTGGIDADVRGRLDERFAEALAGRARLRVTSGVLRDFPLIAAVNRTLRLAEAESRDTRFERLSATLSLENAVATTSDLEIDAADLRVRAAGTIGFDGALDLRGRAIVSAARAAEAVARVHELARLRTRGEMVLPLTISGTLDQPRFGIDLNSAVEQGVRDELRRRLKRIIK